MSSSLFAALAALNLHRNGDTWWLSYDAEISDESLGIVAAD